MSVVVRVPRRHQGIPAGLSAAASSRDPASLAEIEAKAVEAVRGDPWRAWEFIELGESALPATTTTQRVATNPRRGPMDHAEIANVAKTVYNSASWRACKPERVKGGRTIPADRPSIFPTEAEAQATLDRYRRLGSAAGVPMAAHLQYAVIVPLAEWEALAGQATVDRERQTIQHEVELEGLSAQQRELMARIKELQQQLDRPSPPVQHSDSTESAPTPEHGSEEWKSAIVEAVRGGEGSTSVARRFGTNDRQVRRYLKRAHHQQPDRAPLVSGVIDPSELGE